MAAARREGTPAQRTRARTHTHTTHASHTRIGQEASKAESQKGRVAAGHGKVTDGHGKVMVSHGKVEGRSGGSLHGH